MGDEAGIELSPTPLLHYAARQDVVFWTIEPAAETLDTRASAAGQR